MSLNAVRQKIKRAHTHNLYVKGPFDICWLEYQTFVDGLVNGNNENDEFKNAFCKFNVMNGKWKNI